MYRIDSGNTPWEFPSESKIVVLDGGIRCPKANAWVLGHGDAVDPQTLALLASKFECVPTTILEVKPCS